MQSINRPTFQEKEMRNNNWWKSLDNAVSTSLLRNNEHEFKIESSFLNEKKKIQWVGFSNKYFLAPFLKSLSQAQKTKIIPKHIQRLQKTLKLNH